MTGPNSVRRTGVSNVRADGWAMRSVRAGVFAASSISLAAAAHRLGGGMQPTRAVLLAAVLVLFGFGLLWSRRERRGPAIGAVVVLSQLGLHAAFAYAPMRSMGRGSGSSELNRWAAMLLCHNGTHPATAAQVNAARAALGMGPLPTSMHAMQMASPLTAGGAGMLAMHVGAALVMAWWLRRGERAAWAAARRVVATVVVAGRHVLIAPVPPVTLLVDVIVLAPRRWTFGSGLAGRGPPAFSVPVLTA